MTKKIISKSQAKRVKIQEGAVVGGVNAPSTSEPVVGSAESRNYGCGSCAKTFGKSELNTERPHICPNCHQASVNRL